MFMTPKVSLHLAESLGISILERAEGEEEYVEVFDPILVCLVFEDEHLGLHHSISCKNQRSKMLAFDIPPIVERLRSFVWSAAYASPIYDWPTQL
jgi:hypothetical protein